MLPWLFNLFMDRMVRRAGLQYAGGGGCLVGETVAVCKYKAPVADKKEITEVSVRIWECVRGGR